MKQIMTKLNGNAPGVTLLISLIASVGMGAGWVSSEIVRLASLPHGL